MLKNKKLLASAITIVGSMYILSANAGAWSWGNKKKPEPPKSANIQAESMELVEAHKIYIKTTQETQDAYSKYQEASIDYRKATRDTTESYEKQQKAAALWTEAAAVRDIAASKLESDYDIEGRSYDEWLVACNKEREAYIAKEEEYVKWAKCNAIQKDASKKREEAYSQYVAALINQRNAFNDWVKVSEQSR